MGVAVSWVRRNAQGQIEAASQSPQPGYVEEMEDNHPELIRFKTNAPLPVVPEEAYNSLLVRRARALNRKGTAEARLEAITIKMGV